MICFSAIHKLRRLTASIIIHRHSRTSGNICALYLSEGKVCEHNLRSNSFSLLIHFATRRYQPGGSSRLSSSALSLLAACALRKTKKLTGIIVIPSGEIRESLSERSYKKERELHATPSEGAEVCTSKRPMFASRSSSYRPSSSSCSRLRLASPCFFLHFR